MDREYLKKLSHDQLIDICLREETEKLRERTEKVQCKDDLRWIHQLMSNTTASGDEKEAAYWVRYRIKILESREDGLFHVHNVDIVKHSGLSEDKLGKVLKKFEERGIIERKLERKPDRKTGKIKTESWLAFDQSFLDNPKTTDFEKNTKHGGTREKSDKANACGCGCTERIVKRRVMCANCGTILDETEKRLGESQDDLNEEVF